MVKKEDFPIKVKGAVIIIDGSKMELNVIYCCECKGENYQIEKEANGTITVLREWIE